MSIPPVKKLGSLNRMGSAILGSPRPRDDTAAVRIHNNELIAENSELKARVTSLTEELRTTREIAAKNHRHKLAQSRTGSGEFSTSRREKSPRSQSPNGKSDVVAFVSVEEIATQTKNKHTSSILTQTFETDFAHDADDLRKLKAEVLRSHAECASLQHSIQLLRKSVLGEGSSGDAAEAVEWARQQQESKVNQLHSLLIKANEEIRAREAEIRSMMIESSAPPPDFPRPTYDKGMVTDDPLFDLSVPLDKRGQLPPSELRLREELATSYRTLEVANDQLKQVREELQTAQRRAQTTPGFIARPRTENVGVNVDVLYDFQKLFRLYNRSFTPDAVESLLKDAENAAERRAAEESMKAMVRTNQESTVELQHSLDAARKEIVEAHQKIDELNFALDLERRERNGTGLLGANQSAEARQASAEITFLCDTLAATRAELELLQRRVADAEAERDAAVLSFDDLKHRTQAMFKGCQDIAEIARREADESITNLAAIARQREHEINVLRGQIAAQNRTLETVQETRDALRKECDQQKAKILTLTSSIARLREDYNAQSVALREARAFASSFSNLQLQTPREQGAAEAKSSPRTTSPNAPSASRQKSVRIESPSPTRRGRTGSAEGQSSLQKLESALRKEDTETVGRKDSNASDRSASQVHNDDSHHRSGGRSTSESDATATARLKEEYDELRSCFLLLVPLVPQAETAREVATGVCAGVEKLNERVQSLEKELKKKTVALQTLKKDMLAAQETITALEKKAVQAEELSKKLESKDRLVEKGKRMSDLHRSEMEKTQQDWQGKYRALEAELQTTSAALAQARLELAEGREMMMRLLREEEPMSVPFDDGESEAGPS